MHIYEVRFPLAPTATFKPPDAPVSAYRKVQRDLGLTRAIVVQPSGYGFDNRCTVEAVAQLGRNARGVAVVRRTSPMRSSNASRAGMRGVRFHMLGGGVLPWEALRRLGAWCVLRLARAAAARRSRPAFARDTAEANFQAPW
jgi:D-galactarolactone isomerase